MSFISEACVDIGRNWGAGVLVALESTTYPTTTEQFVKPIREEQSGFRAEVDFCLCYSPERIDPGNRTHGTGNTPKLTSVVSDN